MERPILIIEDNEQNLYLFSFILRKHGYEVICAREGREGIELAHRNVPRLILLDIQLPVMDGFTVAEELKKDPLLKDVAVVAITSYAMAGDRERILSAGCSAYLEKPINPETFMAQIECFLKGDRHGQNTHRG